MEIDKLKTIIEIKINETEKNRDCIEKRDNLFYIYKGYLTALKWALIKLEQFKPTTCNCKLFKLQVKSKKISFYEGNKVWMANLWSDLPDLLPGGIQIDYCPFCGNKLEIKK